MTNYRRLISYIYAYEGEVKGKNIGFAKLESRNGQCKLSVNVKKVYVGSSDLGVYLLAPGKEIFLGSIFIRSGGGEFRAVVNVENAADSGCCMDQCYGLTIHEQGDSWRAYTTIWEDAVAHAAEVELADVTSSKVGDAEAQIHRKVEELNQELRAGEKAEEGGNSPVLSSSPAGAREMRVAGKQNGIQESSLKPAPDSGIKDDSANMQEGRESVESVQEAEISQEEMILGTAGAETAETAETQEEQADSVPETNGETAEVVNQMDVSAYPEAGEELELEPVRLPDTQDSMEMEPESLEDKAPDGLEETQESEDTSDSPLECQSERAAAPGNKDAAGTAPVEDLNQADGATPANREREQEQGRGTWNNNWNSAERQQNTQRSWNEKNVTSIRKQLSQENGFMPRGLQTPQDSLNMGAPRPDDMVPDTGIPLQPDNTPVNRTVPRPNIMTRPGMPRRHMPTGTMNTGVSGGQSDRERMPEQYSMKRQPMGGQPPVGGQQPAPNQRPMPNRRPVSQQPSQGSQPFIGEAGPEAADSSTAMGPAEEKVPVVDTGEETLILGNPRELERLEQEEQQSDFPGRLWDGFRKRYPKIQAFDSSNGCEILTIKPQDIGLLPRENWNYGNNSFLLHGYYNYRYLILARIGDETKGRTRYILGVPGNYYSNEKYMASMFGFPHFVLARKQPSQDGRFGYWYTDVRLENQD